MQSMKMKRNLDYQKMNLSRVSGWDLFYPLTSDIKQKTQGKQHDTAWENERCNETNTSQVLIPR